MFSYVVRYVFGSIWPWIKPLLAGALKAELAVVLPLAAEVVRTFARETISGAGKRDGAYAAILDQLRAQSITVAESTIRLAIELAVKGLKEPPK